MSSTWQLTDAKSTEVGYHAAHLWLISKWHLRRRNDFFSQPWTLAWNAACTAAIWVVPHL